MDSTPTFQDRLVYSVIMPKRPPKKWFKDCIKGVKESGGAYDPQAVCGSLWHQKMTDKERREVTREYERKKRQKKLKDS